MKTQEELNALKEEIEALNEKIQELTPEELEQVSGGAPLARPAGNFRDGVVIVGDAIEAEGGIRAALGVTSKETKLKAMLADKKSK